MSITRDTSLPAPESIQALCNTDARLCNLEPEAHSPHNHLSPVSNLPPELLSKIIRLAVWEEDMPSKRDDTFSRIYGLHLIVASVSLWTDIRAPYLSFAPILIERSGAAPLKVDLRWIHVCAEEPIPEALKLFKEHHDRIRHLAVTLSFGLKHPLPFLWTPAPMMEYFRISGGILNPNNSSTLFAGLAPRLTYLKLNRTRFSWDMPLLHSIPCLESLTIIHPDDRPSFDRLARILQSMPLLKSLEFLEALPLPADPSNPPATIALSRVTYLSISGTTLDCASFLNCALLEGVLTYRVSCTEDIIGSPYAAFQTWLSSVWRNGSRDVAPIRSLEVLTPRAVNGCIIDASGHGHPRNPENKLFLEWSPPQMTRGVPTGFVPWLLSVMPLSECINFKHTGFFDPEGWRVCVNHLPSLQYLYISALPTMGEDKFQDLVDALFLMTLLVKRIRQC
ncbi:hypothetical protein AX16_005831 [Volvariella volvacea WC 439]|nr:hypothetical protein AX16_005831 [Volvariella volvacea WC 439]